MAKIESIYSVGNSIVTFLKNTYPGASQELPPCEFRLLSSGEMGNLASVENMHTSVTLYLYRIAIDEHARNKPHNRRPDAKPFPLALCLYYLMIIWADDAFKEHTIAAWVLSQLHQHPVLDKSTLSDDGGWDENDLIHLVPIEMSNEDLMRLWDEMKPAYRLSLPYLARVICIDPDVVKETTPVVATRYAYGDNL